MFNKIIYKNVFYSILIYNGIITNSFNVFINNKNGINK